MALHVFYEADADLSGLRGRSLLSWGTATRVEPTL